METEISVFVVSATPPEIETVINAKAGVNLGIGVEGRLLFRDGKGGVVKSTDCDIGVAVKKVLSNFESRSGVATNTFGLVLTPNISDVVV